MTLKKKPKQINRNTCQELELVSQLLNTNFKERKMLQFQITHTSLQRRKSRIPMWVNSAICCKTSVACSFPYPESPSPPLISTSSETHVQPLLRLHQSIACFVYMTCWLMNIYYHTISLSHTGEFCKLMLFPLLIGRLFPCRLCPSIIEQVLALG